MIHNTETLRRFLNCLYEHEPICVSKVSLKTGLTNQTSMTLKRKLLVTNHIHSFARDNRSSDLYITERGKGLLKELEEILKA